MSAMTPYSLHSVAQVRAMEKSALKAQGMIGLDLMQRAGRAAFALLRRRWPQARRIAVLCGNGNNGGDGGANAITSTLSCSAAASLART